MKQDAPQMDLLLVQEHLKKPSNPLILKSLVEDFFKSGRLVESKFFGLRLIELSRDLDSMILCFKIACRMCDQKWAFHIAGILGEIKTDHMTRDTIHTLYYLTFSNIPKLKDATLSLAGHDIKDDQTLTILFQSVKLLDDIEVCLCTVRQQCHRVKLSPYLEKSLKKTLIRGICFLIQRKSFK